MIQGIVTPVQSRYLVPDGEPGHGLEVDGGWEGEDDGPVPVGPESSHGALLIRQSRAVGTWSGARTHREVGGGLAALIHQVLGGAWRDMWRSAVTFIMMDWESRAITSPDVTDLKSISLACSSASLPYLPCSFPSFCGFGIFFLTVAVIRERPIIFFFLLVSVGYKAWMDTSSPHLASTPIQSMVRRDFPSGNWRTMRGEEGGTASTLRRTMSQMFLLSLLSCIFLHAGMTIGSTCHQAR